MFQGALCVQGHPLSRHFVYVLWNYRLEKLLMLSPLQNMCFYILCHLGDEEWSEEAGNLGEGVGDPKQDPRVRAGLQII